MRVYLRTERFCNYLIRNNLSQNWLAQKLGVSSGYLSQLLRGQRSPSPAVRQRIMELFVESGFDDLFEIRQCGRESRETYGQP